MMAQPGQRKGEQHLTNSSHGFKGVYELAISGSVERSYGYLDLTTIREHLDAYDILGRKMADCKSYFIKFFRDANLNWAGHEPIEESIRNPKRSKVVKLSSLGVGDEFKTDGTDNALYSITKIDRRCCRCGDATYTTKAKKLGERNSKRTFPVTDIDVFVHDKSWKPEPECKCYTHTHEHTHCNCHSHCHC
jgi:hypothetical protein